MLAEAIEDAVMFRLTVSIKKEDGMFFSITVCDEYSKETVWLPIESHMSNEKIAKYIKLMTNTIIQP